MMNRTNLLSLPPEKLCPLDVRRLGDGLGGLAPWWLRPDVLERYEQERGWRFPRKSELPRTHGSCWIVMVQRQERPWPSVRDAFFLPLHWQKGGGWDERLPGRLLDRAKELAVELDLPDYGLHLHPALQPTPRAVASPPGGFEFDSAAISLAGGLYLAARDGEPDPTVGASACWKKAEGVLGVDGIGLGSKLELARTWGLKTFFVAREQVAEAGACGGSLNIRGLPQGRSRLETAVQELVVHQKAEPARPDGLHDRESLDRNVAHWAFLPAEYKDGFYQRNLYPWVLCRFAGLVLKEPGAAQAAPLRALVTVVSGQKDTTILAARALSHLGVNRCLLLYSTDRKGEQQRKARAIKDDLGQKLELAGQVWPVISCEPAPFAADERLLGQLAAQVRAFCSQCPAERLVLDITGGKSLMRWVADHAMPAGSWRFCMDNDEYLGNRPKPLTERPQLWRGSQDA